MKKILAFVMVFLIALSTFSVFVSQLKAEPELVSLPAGATNSANGRDTETILLSIDVDSETSGDQQVVTASPGETITVTATFQVWSSGGPGIIKQAFFIYSWTPSWPPPSTHYEPLYNGQPGYHPGVTQTKSFSVTVPEDAGVYYLWFGLGAHYSMEQAVNQYTTPLTLPAHAKIVVGAPVLSATIDLDPDTLNLRSRGKWITCYIELPGGYNVSDIDRTTILLNDTFPVDPSWVDKPLESVIGDYDGDGVPDLMVKFNRTALTSHIYHVLGITYGNVMLRISGNLTDGTPFEGSDTIKVIFVGDVNDDCCIDSTDLGIFGVAWSNNPYNPNCDFNSDGAIDSTDYGLLATNYGATVP